MLSQRTLTHKLGDDIGHDLLIIIGKVIASILLFRSQAATQLKAVMTNSEENDMEIITSQVADCIRQENHQLKEAHYI